MPANDKRVQVLLPVAVSTAFDYELREGMELEKGRFVKVPFGGKDVTGIVWEENGDPKFAHKKARGITSVMELPKLPQKLMEFIEWVSSYNMAEKGAVLAMAIAPVKNLKPSIKKKKTENIISKGEGLVLSPEQEEVFQKLLPSIEQDKFGVTLLDGVTGSGKTEVYFAAITKSLAEHPDHQILIMLPEIALTSQIISRVKKRLGIEPVLWHSHLAPTKRARNWLEVLEGKAKVIIGARSSLFLPYKKLSLIVIDEEHEQSYKQEEGVIYNARDMAVVRAKIEEIPLILVSATPSLETVINVKSGKYSEISLKNRFGEAQMPNIEVVDLRLEKLPRNSWVSEKLRHELAQTMARGEQSLIYMNRRGYAPLTICRACGHHLKCPNCSSWLVLHSKWRESRVENKENSTLDTQLSKLICHHCGYSSKMMEECPSCHVEGKLVPLGPGVERLEEEILDFLPQARIANMSSDSVTTAKQMKEIFEKIENKEIDIIIGTQMVAKGHHFPELTLVGIIDADSGLIGGDIRASERTFQVLEQVSGRAGREKLAGKVIIQTFQPENRVIQTIISRDRQKFLEMETDMRQQYHLPPFGKMASLIISGTDEMKVRKFCRELAGHTPYISGISILGPAPAPLTLLKGRYRYRFLVKSEGRLKLQPLIRKWLDSVENPASIRVRVDIDPYSFM